jgi:hypothetical protein
MKKVIVIIALFLIVFNILAFFFFEEKSISLILNLFSLAIIIFLCYKDMH